jgi:type I restriction enzyme S subunit
MVPNGWKYVYLGDVITHKKGFAFNSSLYRDKGIRIVRISDTTRNSVHSENPVYLDKDDASGLEQYILNKDDIILSTVGSRPHLLDSMVGKAVKVPTEAAGSLLNQNLVKITPESSKIINQYLYEMIKNKKFIFFISILVRGNANQVSITLADLFQYEFLLPPLPEQRKIAAILSTWDKAITTTEQLLANSQQQKKALMQQLLTGKKRLLDENGERFRGEWGNSFLSEIAFIVMGSSPKSEAYNENECGLPLLQGNADIKNRISMPRTFTSQITKECFYGDILLSVRAPVGSVAISRHHACIGRGIASIKAKKNSVQEFLYQWLLWFEPRWDTFSQGSTFESINSDDIKSLKIHLPSTKEQQKIASVLTVADEEISALQQKIEALKQEKKSLMQQLLTGKRRVKVDNVN